LNFRILGNQRWIRGLAINKPDQVLDPKSLIRVATSTRIFVLGLFASMLFTSKELFFLEPSSYRRATRFNTRQNFRSDVVLVNVRVHKHFPQARNHGGRSGNVIDGSLEVGQVPSGRWSPPSGLTTRKAGQYGTRMPLSNKQLMAILRKRGSQRQRI